MYHLLISGNPDSWSGEPFVFVPKERGRCLTEYTDPKLTARYSELRPEQINELRRYPCIFGYEGGHHKAPKFGVITNILNRSGGVKLEYELISIDPFLTAEELKSWSFDLDIAEWELGRTHWALKDVDLAKELNRHGIALPVWARTPNTRVDITSHKFDVALSFPGDVRNYVRAVAESLERILGPHSYFYDDNYVSQLARPSLDALLQDLYGNRSKLIVLFVCGAYQEKTWCGIEFKSVKRIINDREHGRVMIVRMDDGVVEGIFPEDGFVDSRKYTPAEVAGFIVERVELADKK